MGSQDQFRTPGSICKKSLRETDTKNRVSAPARARRPPHVSPRFPTRDGQPVAPTLQFGIRGLSFASAIKQTVIPAKAGTHFASP